MRSCCTGQKIRPSGSFEEEHGVCRAFFCALAFISEFVKKKKFQMEEIKLAYLTVDEAPENA